MPIDRHHILQKPPFSQRLEQAAAMIAAEQYVPAAALLEETLAALEKMGSADAVLDPIRQLTADSLRQAAARFAMTHPYSNRVDQRVRVEWLEKALELYGQLKDSPNQAHTLRALATATLILDEPIVAMYHLRAALTIAIPLLIFDASETHLVFTQMADALQQAFEKFAEHRTATHYNLAVEGAAYLYLAGDPARAMASLDELHERYIQAAQWVHATHNDGRALRLLVQGIYWGLVTGHSDEIERYADLVVSYATQVNDVESVAVYERAIALRQARASELAQRLIIDRAKVVLAQYSGVLDLKSFHNSVDMGVEYQIQFVNKALKDLDPLDPRAHDLTEVKRQAAMLQLNIWAQTIHALVPTFAEVGDRLMLDSVMRSAFDRALNKASAAFLEAHNTGLAYRRAHHHTSPVSVALMRMVESTQWKDPASVQMTYQRLAMTFQCTSAEVELALMPQGVGTEMRERLRQTLGEYEFDLIQRLFVVHGIADEYHVWEDARAELK